MSDAAAQDGLPTGRRRAAVACLCVGLSMTVLDVAMVNVALPGIARDLDVSASSATWVVNAFQLVLVGLLLPLASMGEILGFRRVYQWGVAIYLLGALGAALAPSLPLLVACRAFQGIGCAAMMSLNAGLMRHIYPSRLLGSAIAVIAMTVALSSAAGPTLGAFIISLGGWQALFLLAVPIGAGVLLLGARALPEVAPQPRRFDGFSALLNLLGFVSLFLGLDMLPHIMLLGLVLIAFAAGCLFLLVHRLTEDPTPLLPLDLLRIRPVRLAMSASACMFAAQAMLYVALPFHLTGAGRTVREIGLMVSPWPLAVAIAASIAGRVVDRINTALPCIIGSCAVAAGMITIALLPPGGEKWPFMLAMFFSGLGFGAFQTPNNRTILGQAPRHRAASAGGMQSTGRVLGQATGTTIVAMVFHFAGVQAQLALLIGALGAAMAAMFNTVRSRA
ncbi:MFS transporter [Rhodovarius crocodyli]|uniref:MFS transporter n=1 Tax=Rhodovarius crocodyli TaxID=1979269 RepID=A0A437MH71_9PROT|nr:MFS transporter [Rhodovarius crocodyli]RVT96993.1 MFS transporter [Rhodovarius crocodyli]